MNDDTKIAGSKKVKDWKELKAKLTANSTDRVWEEAFTKFLLTRITTRYLEPIEAISRIHKQQGKGFSVIAIYCSLIEFFETLKKGYEFRNQKYYDRSGNMVKSTIYKEKNGKFKPLSTKEIFANFLTENLPFNSVFTNLSLGNGFYTNVRCSILHQAETQSNWLIKDGKLNEYILYQDNTSTTFQTILRWKPLAKVFNDYLNVTYKNLLFADQTTKNNFIFKWDKICQI